MIRNFCVNDDGEVPAHIEMIYLILPRKLINEFCYSVNDGRTLLSCTKITA